MPGILAQPIEDFPIAVVDVETTGLYPGADRVIEISVVRWEADREPELLLDTLVNPERPVAATEIHGITDGDVADAPTFADIAGLVADGLAGAVLAAYNVYFDKRFLEAEFSRVKFSHAPPYLCLMYLRPMLGLGKKCALAEACREAGIEHPDVHTASLDARAATQLWLTYLDAMHDLEVRTYGDLRRRKAYKFVESFESTPFAASVCRKLKRTKQLKPRGAGSAVVDGTERLRSRVHEYWDAVTAAVADLVITQEELDSLRAIRVRLNVSQEEMRAVHGRVFAGMLGDAVADSRITDDEWNDLKRLYECLTELGWAPGM